MGRWLVPLSALAAFMAASMAATSLGQGVTPDVRSEPPGLAIALAAHERSGQALRARPGVVGSGVGVDANGQAAVVLFVEDGTTGLPDTVDGIPVVIEVTGKFHAFTSTTDRHRPVLPGVSIGHPSITAGTAGARVANGSGNVFVLSNNHVLAGVATANPPASPPIGDPIYQPGVADGGTAADTVGTLAGYVPLKICSLFQYPNCLANPNTMDAAIAAVGSSDLSAQTFCGWTPSATTITAAIGMAVKKCGRTTGATASTITAVNVTLDVCYDFFCFTIGVFANQIAIGGAAFSEGGDSGSLVVTDNGNANPVGLLFAGGTDTATGNPWTIANPIGPVLSALGVQIDTGGPPPPTNQAPVVDAGSDQAITLPAVATLDGTVSDDGLPSPPAATTASWSMVSGPGTVAFGNSIAVDTTASFSVAGSYRLRLTASDGALGGSDEVVVTVNPAPPGVHVADLVPGRTRNRRNWTAQVTVVVHDGDHQPASGVTVSAAWGGGGSGTGSCVTGADGTCTILKSFKFTVTSVVFTVTNLVKSGSPYTPAVNHTPPGNTLTIAQPL